MIEPDQYDMEVCRKAAAQRSFDIYIDKVVISEDGHMLRFQVDAYKPLYGHCRDSLISYVNIIRDSQRLLYEKYEDLKRQKDGSQVFDAFGIRPDGTMTDNGEL